MKKKEMLLVTADPGKFDGMVQVLTAEGGVQISTAARGTDALDFIASATPDAVVIDASVGDESGLEIAKRSIMTNAMVNIALVSPLSDEAFHEASEGLGLLCKLSPVPGAEEARKLLETLQSIPVF